MADSNLPLQPRKAVIAASSSSQQYLAAQKAAAKFLAQRRRLPLTQQEFDAKQVAQP